MDFSYESFQVPGDTEQTLCVYSVEPESPSAEALRLLRGWTAPPTVMNPADEPTPRRRRVRPHRQ
jgi:hypothetical protein